MGVRLTDGQLRVMRAALKKYGEIKRKEHGKKAKIGIEEKEDAAYERLHAIVCEVSDLLCCDDCVHSVYVNRKHDAPGHTS